MIASYAEIISKELEISLGQVENTLELLSEGNTVPFIARYRKEMTGSLDEVQITRIRDRSEKLRELDKRRESILESIREQDKLNPELERQILDAASLTELEDLYLPYRPKRKTRATIAVSRGLEPLAKMIMAQNNPDPMRLASRFVDRAKEVNTAEEALAGARDIIAEWINENKFCRSRIRNLFFREAIIHSRILKGKEQDGIHYENYYNCSENLTRAVSHRVLAMFRGEKEGFLKVEISPPEEKAVLVIENLFIKSNNSSSDQVKMAIRDGYKRLLQPSLETEMREYAKDRADKAAIRVFTDNARQLLMAPPLGQKNVLAIDPGFRSGCKLVCLDRQGSLLHNETIYPHPPQRDVKQALNKIEYLVNAYKIEAIAIGNGTAGRETEEFIKRMRFEKDISVVIVNESGASVYSASAVAREEFPDYDVTVRGAVSIGRRLMDPLAELVKIDPKSIGVGQYQHDVNQPELQKSLEDVVVSCVNSVGVEVNTASRQLLNYVSGVGPVLARNIVEHRQKNGPFKSREDLRQVSRFGDKAFEQAAGFIRIRDAENPLDRSAVHPESYPVVNKMAEKMNCSIGDLIEKEELRKQIIPEDYINDRIGLPTLNDILQELAKPGRDPRTKIDFFEFDKNITSLEDVKPGMVVPGIVTNITAFGVFVDIGVHQDGLVHISQLANKYVRDPNEVVRLNQKVKVKVLEVDLVRKRLQLSMKDTAQ